MWDSWIFWVCVFVVSQVVFLQTFKVITKDTKSIGALTVLIQLISAVAAIIISPAFKWTWPKGGDWLSWVLLVLSFILFAVNDRLDATTRKHLDISVDTMLHQSYRLLFVPLLVLAFGVSRFSWAALVGGVVIVFANMFLLYEKGKFRFNRYIIIKLISVVIFAFALISQMKAVSNFNVGFMVMLSYIVPALLLSSVKQATPRTLVAEIKRPQWWVILICGVMQMINSVAFFMAMQYGNRIKVNAITAVGVLLNTIAAFIFLKERKNLVVKAIASAVIVGSMVLIAFSPF